MPYVIPLLFNMEIISGFVGLSNVLGRELKVRKPMAVAVLDLAVMLLGRNALQIMRTSRCWQLSVSTEKYSAGSCVTKDSA